MTIVKMKLKKMRRAITKIVNILVTLLGSSFCEHLPLKSVPNTKMTGKKVTYGSNKNPGVNSEFSV